MAHYNRAQWGARQARPGGNTPTNGPKGVAFHYNGPAMGINPFGPCQCARRVRSIQAFHIYVRGWADIAYDVIACPHGHTFQGRLNTGKGTAANGSNTANRDYMAVMAFIGGTEPLGDKLKDALLSGRELCRRYGAGPAITPHSQHEKTACPGAAITAWIMAGTPLASTPKPPAVEEPDVITDADISRFWAAGVGRGENRRTMAEVIVSADAKATAALAAVQAMAANTGADPQVISEAVERAVRDGFRRAGADDTTVAP